MGALQLIGDAGIVTVPHNNDTPQVFIYEDHSDEGPTVVIRQQDNRIFLTQSQIREVAAALAMLQGRHDG